MAFPRDFRAILQIVTDWCVNLSLFCYLWGRKKQYISDKIAVFLSNFNWRELPDEKKVFAPFEMTQI